MLEINQKQKIETRNYRHPMTFTDKKLAHLMKESSSWLEAGKKKQVSPPDPSAGPRELHFELTYSCNQQCLMCDIWPRYRNEPSLKKQELTVDEIKSMVENSNLLRDLELILFSGGEPFLRPDLVPIVTFFAERYPASQLVILSNFFDRKLVLGKLGEILEAVPRANIMLGTSLDGIGESHDSVRGVPEAFDKFREVLEDIQVKYPQVTVETNFTITPSNYDQLIPAFTFTREKDIGFSAQFPIPWEGTEQIEWTPDHFKKVEEDISRIMEEVYRQESVLIGPPPPRLLIRLQYLKGLLEYEREPRRIFPHCPAPYRYAMISPRGDLYFCPKLKEMVVGNIRETPFDELWLSGKAEKIRRHINSGACHCWLNCTAYINIEKAIERGQPPARKVLVAAAARSYGIYRRLLSGVFRSLLLSARIAVYGLAFIYLLLKIGIIYLGRKLRGSGKENRRQ
ncbi:MAG TPA: radical SAM protein [Proteobacteria bacterium]|nr:radical SAM protein [Pseudomonadota bacterium]